VNQALSDDESNTSPPGKTGKKNLLDLDSTTHSNFANSSIKKNCESSMNIINGLDVGHHGDILNLDNLNLKLLEVSEEQLEQDDKKKEFDQKRKEHYKNEFMMAK
jgi:hypothetical protein